MDSDARGRVAVVTGGAQGIGAAIAHRLAADDIAVAVWDLNPADDVVERIVAAGGRAHGWLVDLTDGAQISAAADGVREYFGSPSIVINNAGRNASADPVTATEDEWESLFAVDLKAAWLVARAFLAEMLEARAGSIVNIASVHATLTQKGYFPYAAAKSGLVGLTRSLALEVADAGVRVNAVSPGWVRTPLVDAWLTEVDTIGEAAILDTLPMGRMATPDEVAHVVAFLAGDGASYVTGANWSVDGGLSSRFA